MVKSEQKEIDGFIFHVTQMPALVALRMKARLLGVVGPALSSLFQGSKEKLLERDVSTLAPVLEALAERLDPDVFANLCMDLFRGVQVVGEGKKFEPVEETGFNALFTGRLPMMYKALYFVLQVNDFFGLGAIGKGLLAKAPEANPKSAPNAPRDALTKA